MGDLISRQAAIEAIRVYMSGYKRHIGKPDDSEVYAHSRGLLLSIEMSMNALPSAEPKKGEWKLHKSRALWICNNCKDTSLVTSRFCPNCGAEMEVSE